MLRLTVGQSVCLGVKFTLELVSESCCVVSQSQSQSHATTHGQSVSMSWCQVHSGTCDQILFSVWKLLCCLCGAPSLTRGRGLSPVSHCHQYLVHCQRFNTIYIVHVTCFKYAIYTRPLSAQAQYSRSCQNLSYNSSLDTWTVVRLTASKFKPLMFLCCLSWLVLVIQPQIGPYGKYPLLLYRLLLRPPTRKHAYLRSRYSVTASVKLVSSWSLHSTDCICYNIAVFTS
jgi:hypothetical protein